MQQDDKYLEHQEQVVNDFINSTPAIPWREIHEIAHPLIMHQLREIYRVAHKAGMHEGLEIAKQYGVGK